jgi:alpha-1,6-mannosyltransferase
VVALVGAVGSALLALASDLPGSPYGPKAGSLWPLTGSGTAPGWEGPKIPTWAGVPNQGPGVPAGRLLATLAAVVGVALLVLAWITIWRTLRHERLHHIRSLWWVVGAWITPLLFASPLASQDVWHYGAEGKMVVDGFGGYRPVTALGHSVWTLGVDGKWAAHPSLYGPGALNLSALFVRISGGRPWVAAECWRLSAIIGLALGAWGVHRIVTRCGGSPTKATLAAVANPAVLIILVGGIHNDALMIGLTVAGVALALSGNRSWGVVLCALGVDVKPTALLAVGALAWWAWGSQWRHRVRGALTSAVAVVGVLALSGIGVGGGFGWIKSLSSYANLPGPWSLGAQFFGTLSGRPVTAIELGGTALGVLLILRARRTNGWIAALGWGFAALAVTTPGPQPWYLAWGLVCLASGGLQHRTERIGVFVLSTMMAAGALPLGVLLWFEGIIALAALGILSVRRFLRNPTPPSSSPLGKDGGDEDQGDVARQRDRLPSSAMVATGSHRL